MVHISSFESIILDLVARYLVCVNLADFVIFEIAYYQMIAFDVFEIQN